jgi:class 3 adenylate cyclase
MDHVLKLTGPLAREAAIRHVREAPDGYVVTIRDPKRTLDQNAAQWPLLAAFSEQLEWPVNGVTVRITAEEWKDILTAAFRNEQPRVAAGLNGGMVLLGQRTSKFSAKEFSEWLDFLWFVATERGVEVRPAPVRCFNPRP